jgi:hypothetical protein
VYLFSEFETVVCATVGLVANFLAAHGLKLERYEPCGEESAGKKPSKKPFGGLVVAVSVRI